jgi:hypothetical protein
MADSVRAAPTPPKPEAFSPPQLTSLASLTDGRRPGDYESVYPFSCWIHISAEFLYRTAAFQCRVGGAASPQNCNG